MHPARKFSQNICKNKTLNIQSALNKENDKSSLTESFAKKFSVGSHVISDESDQLKDKRSIVDQKISVFLQHSSQNRTALFEKNINDNEVKYINKILQNEEGTVVQILSHELEKNQVKSQDMKKLICTLVQKLSEEEKTSQQSDDSFRLTDHIMRPYLEQQILLLQKNLSKLKSREQDLTILKGMSETEKKFLVQTLKELEASQKKQLVQLR